MIMTIFEYRMIVVLFLVQAFVLGACDDHCSKLEYALSASGENRIELERVIHHYSGNDADSLKLKAILFLVENMPGHVTLTGDRIYENNIEVDQARGSNTFFEKKVFKMLPLRNPLERRGLCVEEDIHRVKAEYLIHHIDKCFELWHTRPWLRYLSLSDFLEYLLPYRVEEEVLDNWIDSCAIPKRELHDILNYFDDIKYSVTRIGNYMQQYLDGATLHYKDSTKAPYFTDCIDVSLIKLFKYRSVGIPCAIDYVPCWSGTGGTHHWLRVIDPLYKDGGVPQVYHRTAKVYRRTFSRNEYPEESTFVSSLFKDAFSRDVTDEYVVTSDVSVPCNQGSMKNGYLAVFYKLNWTPVACGNVEDNRIIFKKMGREVVYLPVYYKNRVMGNLGYPFLVDGKGHIHTFIPNKKDSQKMRLSRKYPGSMVNSRLGNELIGCKWVGANRRDFRDSVILHKIEDNPGMEYVTKYFDGQKLYRYFKCTLPGSFFSIAELHFFDQAGEVTGTMLVPPRDERLPCINDNDPLTYFDVDECLVIDFGTPKTITKVSFLSRNDGNGINPGHTYELFYFDSGGWQSLGKKEGGDFCLEYDNVPSNALYWLRDLTTGVEERIFTCCNNQITFW